MTSHSAWLLQSHFILEVTGLSTDSAPAGSQSHVRKRFEETLGQKSLRSSNAKIRSLKNQICCVGEKKKPRYVNQFILSGGALKLPERPSSQGDKGSPEALTCLWKELSSSELGRNNFFLPVFNL